MSNFMLLFCFHVLCAVKETPLNKGLMLNRLVAITAIMSNPDVEVFSVDIQDLIVSYLSTQFVSFTSRFNNSKSLHIEIKYFFGFLTDILMISLYLNLILSNDSVEETIIIFRFDLFLLLLILLTLVRNCIV